MILSKQVWVSNALSKNGRHYHVMLFLLPVLPLGIVGFVWYILWGEEYNLFVLCFVAFVSAVLLHQEVEITRFIRVAARTVKRVVSSDDGDFIIYLFSNKTLTLSEFSVSKDIPDALNNNIYRRLFPKDKENGIIRTSEGEYYLTGTINDFENLYQRLKEKATQPNVIVAMNVNILLDLIIEMNLLVMV